MDIRTELIASDDSQQAPGGSFRKAALVRMVGSMRPYRLWLSWGILASIVYALLHSVSILGALPILKVLLEEEGLHGWVDREVAGARLGAEFIVQAGSRRDDGSAVGRGPVLVLRKVSEDSPLARMGLQSGDAIAPVASKGVGDAEGVGDAGIRSWLSEVANGPLDRPALFAVVSHVGGDATQVAKSVGLEEAPWRWSVVQGLVSMVPETGRGGPRLTALAYVLGGVVIVVVLANVSRFVGEYLISLSIVRAMMDIRRALYAKVLKLPMSRFTRNTGDMVSRFVQDVQDVQRGLKAIFGKAIREPLKAVFILTAALALDWRITVTMLAIAPLAMVVFWWVGGSMKRANKQLLRGYGVMLDALTQTMAAIPIVKAYTTENVERRRLWQIDRKLYAEQSKIVLLEAALGPIMEAIGVVAVAAVTLWLGGQVIDGGVSPSRFGTIVILLGMMSDPLRKLADLYARMIRSTAGGERLFEILDAPVEADVIDGAVELTGAERSIEFREVTFTYPEADRPALSDFSLTIRSGEALALVGPNGSGKSTVINLLLRFYDPQRGVVLIDGVNTREASLRSLRKLMGLVSQDTVIFPISLADNIAYGSRNGSMETVVDAARRAYADEFISEKPGGYGAVPGTMGRTLSGGQKQRLAIARAILRDPPILIFDEATSQVDAESEQKIQTALQAFSRGRTTLLVAHRLSTIRFADRIAVMDSGRLIDLGTHDELVARCHLYQALCETQLSG